MRKISGVSIVILGLISSSALQADHKARAFAKKEQEREVSDQDQNKSTSDSMKESLGDLDVPASKAVQKQGSVKSETSHGHIIVIPRASKSSGS